MKSRWLTFAAVGSVALLLFIHFRVREVRMPAQLVGTWKTNATQYADRSMEIGLVSVTFATGPGTESTGFVEDIRSSVQDGKTLYTISYSTEGTRNEVSFYYISNGDETIQFRNQDQIVWKKEKE